MRLKDLKRAILEKKFKEEFQKGSLDFTLTITNIQTKECAFVREQGKRASQLARYGGWGGRWLWRVSVGSIQSSRPFPPVPHATPHKPKQTNKQ